MTQRAITGFTAAERPRQLPEQLGRAQRGGRGASEASWRAMLGPSHPCWPSRAAGPRLGSPATAPPLPPVSRGHQCPGARAGSSSAPWVLGKGTSSSRGAGTTARSTGGTLVGAARGILLLSAAACWGLRTLDRGWARDGSAAGAAHSGLLLAETGAAGRALRSSAA